MPRQLFTDDYWDKFKAIMLSLGIYDKPSLRQTVEGIFYRMRVGCPWRDLPIAFGNWNAVYKRFNAWSFQEKLMNIFRMLVVEPDLEWAFIDGSIVKAHQHSSGAAHEQESAIGKSVAGNTTKIHIAVTARISNRVDSHLSPISSQINCNRKSCPAQINANQLAFILSDSHLIFSGSLYLQMKSGR